MLDSVQPVLEAIEKGDIQRARQLLRPLMQNPTADVWYAASFVYDQPEKQLSCLNRALKLDPLHGDARRRLKALRQGEAAPLEPRLELPPIDLLVENVPKTTSPPPAPKSIWNARNRRRRRNWALIGVAGSALLSLSATYFVLTVLGSPIPAQLRSLLTGSQPSNEAVGTPVFGQPSNVQLGDPSSGESGGTVVTTNGDNTNTVVVRVNQSKPLQWEKPLSDVLDAGYAHEYTFIPLMGDEVAIGIQFFSPTATNVGPNVAVLDPLDVNAEQHCERDAIFQDDSGIAFICQINQPGQWKVQILGRQGESTGVYVITVDRF